MATTPEDSSQDPPSGQAPKEKAANLLAALGSTETGADGGPSGGAPRVADGAMERAGEAAAASASFQAFAASDTGEDASRVLRDAVKRAPLPSLSGLSYEIMGLAWVLGVGAGLAVLSHLSGSLSYSMVNRAMGPLFTVPAIVEEPRFLIVGIPAILLAIRIATGLAAIAAEGVGQGGGANAWRAWKLGGRDAISSIGIAFQIFGMMTVATLTLLTPLILLGATVGKETLGLFGVVLSGLALAFMLVYGAALGALQQLSMASLVRHQRGVGSAILHGWRLMRARPRSSQRMAAAEFASRVIVLGLAVLVGRLAGWGWGLCQLILAGALVGGLRCHAWSLAYPRVGGLDR